MDVLTAIEKRREITHFSPDLIPDEVLDKLVKSLYLSPSGNNLPSREFILVTKRETLKALTPATPYMKWLENAATAVIIIGNPDLSKYWVQDATLSGGFLWLTAVSLGLGAAWGAVYHSEDPEESARRESFVRERLAIPNHYRVVSIIGLGFPAKEPPAKEMSPLERVFHRETYKRK